MLDGESIKTYGLLGKFRLNSGWKLLVISQCSYVGEKEGQRIYHIEEVTIVSLELDDRDCPPDRRRPITKDQEKSDARMIQEIHNMYDGGGFYFADVGDLTHSVLSFSKLHRDDPSTIGVCK